jgi:hypothetical protein
MKSTKWMALVVAVALPLVSGYAQGTAAGAANISPSAAEVVRLASSGVGQDVVLAYVQNSKSQFNLSADDVLYLRDVGVTQPVITAMLNHDSALRAQEPQSPPAQYAPAATEPAPAPAPAAPTTQVVAATPTYVSSPPADVAYFYNDLAPYGTWVSLPGVGWCWQPTVVVVNRGWRPYCHGGHWVYTDAGWFWQSDYSWGWAPFHYGRWYLDAGCGWVWTPGRVWGPAWVTWRTLGTTCGWAPLPPGADFSVGIGWRCNGVTVGANFGFGLGVDAFAFVSFGNFCANDVYHHCLPPDHVRGIYHQTTIVNNYTVVNHNFVNRGIPVERIGAASHSPVPRAALHDAHRGQPNPPGGKGPVVYRTQLGKPEPSQRMMAQRVDGSHPRIEHTAYQPMGAGRGYSRGSSGPGSGPQPTPALNSQGGGRPTTANRGGGATMRSTPGSPAQGQQQASPRSGSTTPPMRGNQTYQWQGSGRPSYGQQNLSAPKNVPDGALRTGPTASSGPQPATKPPAYSPGSPSNAKPASGPQGSTPSRVYPGGGSSTGTRSFSGSQTPGTAPVSPSSASSGGQPALNHQPSTGSMGSAYLGGGAAQGQRPTVQSSRPAASAQFYTPKTIEQSHQSRPLPSQSNAGAPTRSGSDRRNR